MGKEKAELIRRPKSHSFKVWAAVAHTAHGWFSYPVAACSLIPKILGSGFWLWVVAEIRGC